MGGVTIFLGAWSFAGFLVALILRPRRRRADDVIAAASLVMVWVIGASSRTLFGDLSVDGMKLYLYAGPALDALFLPFCAMVHRSARARWSAVLLYLAFSQMVIHAGFASIYATYREMGIVPDLVDDTYKLALNLTYIAQVACPAIPGAANAISHVGGWLHHLRDRRGLSPVGRSR